MSTPTVAQLMKKFGLGGYNASDPYASIYPVVMARNVPGGISSSNRQGFMNQGEAFLRARYIAYYKSKPGDCGGPSQAGPNAVTTTLKISQASLGAASAVGTLAAGGAAAFAGTTVGAILGPATLGLSLAVIPVTLIEAHHAQAVSTEQSTLCSITNSWNTTAQQLEALLRSGQITEQQADAYIENLADNLVQGLDAIKKVCNAACSYQGFMRAYQDFAINFLYADIENGAIAHYDPADVNPYAPASTVSPSAIVDATTKGPAAVSSGNLTDQSLTKVPAIAVLGPAPAQATVLGSTQPVANAGASASGPSLLTILAIAAAAGFVIFLSKG